MMGKGNEYQQFHDETDDAYKKGNELAEQTQQVVGKGIVKGKELAAEGQKLMKDAAPKLNEAKNKALEFEKQAEHKLEEGEKYVIEHSKELRVVAAVLCFFTWFPFYQLLHTTLRTWDLCVNVWKKLQSNTKKFLFAFFFLFIGCTLIQAILSIFGIIHMFTKCKHLQEDQSALKGFHHLVYEDECTAANKIEESLLIIFGDFHISAEQNQQLADIESQANKIKDLSNKAQEMIPLSPSLKK